MTPGDNMAILKFLAAVRIAHRQGWLSSDMGDNFHWLASRIDDIVEWGYSDVIRFDFHPTDYYSDSWEMTLIWDENRLRMNYEPQGRSLYINHDKVWIIDTERETE